MSPGRLRANRGSDCPPAATPAAANPFASFPVHAVAASSARAELVGIDPKGMMTIRVANLGPDVIQDPGVEVIFGIEQPRSTTSLFQTAGPRLGPGESREVVVGPIPAGAAGARLTPTGSSPTMRQRGRR